MIVEACVASVESALAAQTAGADRIELNSALQLDGLTPSAGLLQRVRAAVKIPIIAMARPRPGDFDYDADQWQTLLAEARWLVENGADGIAFGCVREGIVQSDRVAEIRDLVGEKELVFHKGFEVTSDWKASLADLAAGGIDRVMTSGRVPVAADKADLIGQMVQSAQQLSQRAEHSISILPAGGISSENVGRLINQAGVSQVHGSFASGNRSDDRRGLEAEITRVINICSNRDSIATARTDAGKTGV